MPKKILPLCYLVVLTINGCTTYNAFCNADRKPDEPPPELIATGNDLNARTGWYNGELQKVSWNKMLKFGAVPAELKPQGNQLCQLAGFTCAIGYHPHPIGTNGEIISEGGFLCDGYRNTTTLN